MRSYCGNLTPHSGPGSLQYVQTSYPFHPFNPWSIWWWFSRPLDWAVLCKDLVVSSRPWLPKRNPLTDKSCDLGHITKPQCTCQSSCLQNSVRKKTCFLRVVCRSDRIIHVMPPVNAQCHIIRAQWMSAIITLNSNILSLRKALEKS